jgi:predicted MFS family arabinose efflux permease
MHELPAFLRDALQFQNPRWEGLRRVSDAKWKCILSDWYVVRLTLPLRQTCGECLPQWVRERIDVFLADNTQRFGRIKTAYSKAARAFDDAGTDHAVIKGFSLWPGYTEHPKYRPQSDIDVYCPSEKICCARDALLSIGYRTQPHLGQVAGEHLFALPSSVSREWGGNHFDPDIPTSFKLHFSWWDMENSRIPFQGVDEFWSRREKRMLDDISFPALDPVDNLGHIAIDLLLHLLNNFPATDKVYGLARFLHTHSHDHAFWQRWQELHHDSLRRLEGISFRLASDWFACWLPEEVQEEIGALAPPVQAWFQHFSEATRSTRFDTTKDGLWLHLVLLESKTDKSVIFLQRIAPILPRSRAIGNGLGCEQVAEGPIHANLHSRLSHAGRKPMEYAKWSATRSAHHLAVLPPTLWRGLRFRLSQKNLSPQFWTFFAASFCFDLGMTMYFFLYNLYLLDCGFKENFLGLMMSAMNIGSIACTIPAAILIQRLGTGKSLLFCVAAVSSVSAARALFGLPSAVLALALLGGFLTSIWAVAISPAIALLTDEESRPFGFSLVFSSGIAVGILANLAASRLPGFFMRLGSGMSEMQAKRVVLWVASAIVAVGLIPLSKLKIKEPPSTSRKIYSRNPFLLRFLLALTLWSLVTGSLSPLANVYFSQYLHTPLVRMGTIFSFSNLLQVLGILSAPYLFRKLGLVSGLVCTQLAAALLLGLLAVTSGSFPAAVVYVGFTGFLWMSEPGMFSLLMDGVAPEERAGASALNFLVISLVQAGAVAATGASFTRFGYPAVLGAIAVVALIAALVFWGLLGRNAVLATKPASLNLDV